jgi:hypothetical protein
VVVDGSRCGEVVHVGAVLGVWSNWPERGQSWLSVAAQRRWEWRHGGGRKAEQEEMVLHGGGGRPLYLPEEVDDGGVAAGKRCR